MILAVPMENRRMDGRAASIQTNKKEWFNSNQMRRTPTDFVGVNENECASLVALVCVNQIQRTIAIRIECDLWSYIRSRTLKLNEKFTREWLPEILLFCVFLIHCSAPNTSLFSVHPSSFVRSWVIWLSVASYKHTNGWKGRVARFCSFSRHSSNFACHAAAQCLVSAQYCIYVMNSLRNISIAYSVHKMAHFPFVSNEWQHYEF